MRPISIYRPFFIMPITDEQKTKIAAWIEEGLQPSDVQNQLETEFGIRMTYMEVRFLIDDLKLMPKDLTPPEPTKPAEPESVPTELPEPDPLMGAGGVRVKVDSITRPGAMVSGKVTFSDGKSGEWYLDQTGRLGMVPPEPGYRPQPNDIAEFQIALEKEMVKLGL
jgi:hypothetical protein